VTAAAYGVLPARAGYSAGWRKLVLPSIGHIEMWWPTNGAVDRAVHAWIAEGVGKSSVENALAALVRVTEQAMRDGLIDGNPSRAVGWQREYKQIAAELQNPHSRSQPVMPPRPLPTPLVQPEPSALW
jgi:hypothetical protein